MKNLSKKALPLLICLILGFPIATTLNFEGGFLISEAKASVSEQQVIDYLGFNGLKVFKLSTIDGSDNWQAITFDGSQYYFTIIYVKGNEILDHENVPV